MPRRTNHPVDTLLRALGFVGRSEEMSTPVGDVIQPGIDTQHFDPASEQFGFLMQLGTPPVGDQAGFVIYPAAGVIGMRLWGFSSPVGGGGSFYTKRGVPTGTAQAPPAARPIYSSKGRDWASAFDVRLERIPTAGGPTVFGMFLKNGVNYTDLDLYAGPGLAIGYSSSGTASENIGVMIEVFRSRS